MKPIAALMLCVLLSSCASSPTSTPAAVEGRDVIYQEDTLESASATAFDFESEAPLKAEELNISKGDYYRQLSENAQNEQTQINDAISAAEYYIQGNDYQRVAMAIDNIPEAQLDTIQADRLAVINAYVLFAKGDYHGSLYILQPLRQLADEQQDDSSTVLPYTPYSDATPDRNYLQVDDSELTQRPKLSTQQVDALLLASFNFQALNDYDSALEALIQRERALYGSARAETTRYIWQIINSLEPERLQLIKQSTQNYLVRNRLESSSLNAQLENIDEAPQQFNNWHQENVTHLKKSIINAQWNVNSASNIAVLLPLSSKYKKAAQALKDGIMSSHEQNISPYKPSLSFYDIGADPFQASSYYMAAINAGADFIIGPLGKNYANQIGQFNGSSVNTLLLGGDNLLSANTARFDLSPEMEGQRIAEKAWKDSYLSVAILSDGSNYNRRVSQSFSQTWLSLGGKISSSLNYFPSEYDHSSTLKQLFQINDSQYRHSKLSRTLGYKPKFSEYKRNDIDFILMLSDAKTGRLLRPQINFYSGSSVPVYATSKLFNGIQDKISNVDLDNTRLPVMPWVLKTIEGAPYAGLLNQLFALGSDSYSLASNYYQLRNNSQLAINGLSGQISIDLNGEVVNQPVWASFKNGELVPNETLGLDITPLSELNEGQLQQQSVNGTYNGKTNSYGSSKTYNSQTWDKNKALNKN